MRARGASFLSAHVERDGASVREYPYSASQFFAIFYLPLIPHALKVISQPHSHTCKAHAHYTTMSSCRIDQVLTIGLNV